MPADNRTLGENQLRTIVRAGLAAVAATLALAGVVSASASAAAAVARPAAASPVANELLGVSCTAAKHCLAVGVNHDGFGGAGGPLAEVWNGVRWDTIAVRLPAGATGGTLNGVHCLSAKDCVAVGFYDKGNGIQFALADTWNGSTWTPATAPAPDGGYTLLSGVSCASASRCVAVGTYTTNPEETDHDGAPLGEIWNGRTWRQTKPPTAEGFLLSGLDSVSCAAAASCVAVGFVVEGDQSFTLIESWDGGSWSLMTPAAHVYFWQELLGVSCSSRDYCAAVGAFGSNVNEVDEGSLALISNGKSWSPRTVLWPPATTYPTLLSVSCAAANRCVAVGTIDTDSDTNNGKAASVTYSGKTWTATSVPAPGKGKASLFNDVTCLSATDCVAVGQVGPTATTNGTGLSGFWNGKSWRLVTAR